MEHEEIRQKQMEEMQKRQLEEQKQVEMETQIASTIRSLLTEEARQRLNNVKIVNKELYFKTVQVILYLQKAGQLRGQIGEKELKLLLDKMRNKREIKIKRK